jgi:hypothetical protein
MVGQANGDERGQYKELFSCGELLWEMPSAPVHCNDWPKSWADRCLRNRLEPL